jgi:DNA-binding XRE family transcriptional regulator
MPDQVVRMTDIIRTLRKDCGLTQMEFAAAIGVTATSVHRWEAGTSVPDFEIALDLWACAVEHGSATSRFLAEFLAEKSDAIRPLFSAQQVSLFETAYSAIFGLSPDQQQLVLAFIELLQNNKDQSVDQMMRLLLEPWRKKLIGRNKFSKPETESREKKIPKKKRGSN